MFLLVGVVVMVVAVAVFGATLGVLRSGANEKESPATGAASNTNTDTTQGANTPTNAPIPGEITEPTPSTASPISAATAPPTPALVNDPLTLPPGSDPFVCTGDDRLNHEEPLYSGQVLCSTNQKYVFGMHSDGRFIKRDVIDPNGKNDIFYTGQPGDWFILHSNGDIEIYNLQNELQWMREANFNMTFATCLTEYACPYMHLHDDGVLVLNWKNENGIWQVNTIKSAYNL